MLMQEREIKFAFPYMLAYTDVSFVFSLHCNYGGEAKWRAGKKAEWRGCGCVSISEILQLSKDKLLRYLRRASLVSNERF